MCQHHRRRYPIAARHEGGGAVLLAERGEDAVAGFGLMGERGLAGAFDLRACEPGAEGGEVRRFEFVEVVAGDRVERGALFHQAGEAVAIRNQEALVHAIRQADEGGEFVPGKRRAAVRNFAW